jgi:hypothetical protein
MAKEFTLAELLTAQEQELRDEYDAVIKNSPPCHQSCIKETCDNTLERLHDVNQRLIKQFTK